MALCFFFSNVVSVGRRSLTALGKEWVHAKTGRGTPYFPGYKAIVTYRDTRQGEDSRDLGRDREVICEILLHLVYWRRFAIDCLFSSRVDPQESQPSTMVNRARENHSDLHLDNTKTNEQLPVARAGLYACPRVVSHELRLQFHCSLTTTLIVRLSRMSLPTQINCKPLRDRSRSVTPRGQHRHGTWPGRLQSTLT